MVRDGAAGAPFCTAGYTLLGGLGGTDGGILGFVLPFFVDGLPDRVVQDGAWGALESGEEEFLFFMESAVAGMEQVP